MSSEKIDKIMLVILSIIAIFIPLREFASLLNLSFLKLIPDFCVFISFCLLLVKKDKEYKIEALDYLFLIFLFVGFFSTVVINKLEIMRFLVECRSIVIYYLLFFVIRNLKLSDEVYVKFGRVLQVVVLMIVALAFVEKLTYKQLLFPKLWRDNIIYMDNFVRSYSIFNNPNTFAAFLIFSFIYSYQVFKNPWEKWNGFISCLCLFGILISVSRSTIILLGVFLIGMVLLKKYYSKKSGQKLFTKKTIVVIGSAILLWLGAEIGCKFYIENLSNSNIDSSFSSLDRFEELMGNEIVDKSQSNGRLYSINTGIKVFDDHKIIGSGFGTYGSSASLIMGSPIYTQYDIEPGFYSDNEYIVILAETGIIGVVIFLCWMFSILFKYKKDYFKILLCIVFAGLGMFYNVLETQGLAFLFWLCLATPNYVERSFIE